MPLPRKKNYLRDILPKHGGENLVLADKVKNEKDVIYHKVTEPVIEYGRHDRGGRGWRIWLLAAGAVLVLSVVLLYVFGDAEVAVSPRLDQFSFDGDFTARKSIGAEAEGNNLVFSVLPFEKIGSQSVAADGQKMIEKKASGKITIYNNYSNSSQKLIRNTRFETPDGLIYRIDQSVVVPPMSTVNGKVTPGSVQATVYADEAGVKYNIGPTNFTIPGFKSDPKRYVGFYARSDSPMIDGYSGMASYLTDAKQKLVRLQIRAELEKKILADAVANESRGQFIPKNAYTLEFESLPSSNSPKGQVVVQEKAKVVIYSFKTANWDNFLARNAPFSSTIGSSTVEIVNRDSLDFAWRSRPKPDSPEISFHLKGNAEFVWDVDQVKIAKSLAGRKRGELQNILKQYGEIANATASLSPFWRTSFPADPNKITVIVKSNQ
jgi:hypothetical protein